MKKIFTLVAGMLLVGSGAFAQAKWTNVVVNGDMEGAADPLWSSFWCHDWRTPEQVGEFDEASGQQFDSGGQFQGFAEIVEDPANPANHCAKVYVRSTAEAQEAGNMVQADGAMAGWDSQFFIYAKVDEPIPSGKMLRVSMKYKADKSGPSVGSQAHNTPGNYNHWAMCGNLDFTTDWKTLEWEGILSSDQAPDDKGFYSIAFNLADYKDGYTAYFDDIKMEIKDQEEPHEFEGWLNFLRKGTLSADKINNYTNFTGRDGATGKDQPARIVTDTDGEPALQVTTVAYNYFDKKAVMVPKMTEEGDTVKDEKGEVVMEQAIDDETGEPKFEDIKKYIRYGEEKNDTIDNIDDWQTQFFVTTPHKWVTGQPYKLTLWVRADKPTTLDTQGHTMPGSYVHWNFCGSIDVTEDWTPYNFGDDDAPATIASECNGCQTIAFNCNKDKEEINNIYFRFEEFSFNTADVTASERILGTESVTLPYGAEKDSEVNASINLAEGMNVLEFEDVAEIAQSSNTVLFKNVKVEGEGEEAEEVETFEGVQLTSGVFVDAKGNVTEADDNVIILEADEESKDGILTVKITNGDIKVEEGKNVETKMILENEDGWRYLYNITFITEDVFTGINEMTIAPKSNVIFDLTGRQLTKAAKGLYIMNGKKVMVK